MSDAGLSSVASAIVGSMQKWERKPADFYPSPPEVTYSLIPHIEDILPAGASIWEPACGDGAMSKVFEDVGYAVTSTDLREDSGYGVGGVDFLDQFDDRFDAIITNPPFKVAEKFIAHALQQAPVVAMLLKSQYWHAARRLGLFEGNPPAKVLALTWRPSFLEKERGSSPLMDVIWTVWSAQHSGPTAFYPIRKVTPPPPMTDFDDLLDDFDDLLGAA